jgi:tetratricopeptide (TPR) repeat protein
MDNIDNYEPEEFVRGKGMFGLAIMIESTSSALTYYKNAKDLFCKSIEQNDEYLPSYYYLALTEFRIGLIRDEQKEFNAAVNHYEQALINLEKIKYSEEFRQDIADILPKLVEAYANGLNEIGEILYQQEDFDPKSVYQKQLFLFTKLM